MWILTIVMLFLVAFNEKARLAARKGFNFLVELVSKTGLSLKNSKLLVNIVILILILKIAL